MTFNVSDVEQQAAPVKSSIERVWQLPNIRKQYGLDGSGCRIAVLDIFNRDNHHGKVCFNVAAKVAPKAKVIPYNVASDTTNTFSNNKVIKRLEDIHSRLDTNPIDIVSMSFDFNVTEHDEKLTKLREIIDKLYNAGVILVAAAGNDGDYQLDAAIPARFDQVISVGALDGTGRISDTNPPPQFVDVYAPGQDKDLDVVPSVDVKEFSHTIDGKIQSTHREESVTNRPVQGSSIATPVIAGIIALLKQHLKKKNITTNELKKIFKDERMRTDKGIFHPVKLFENII